LTCQVVYFGFGTVLNPGREKTHSEPDLASLVVHQSALYLQAKFLTYLHAEHVELRLEGKWRTHQELNLKPSDP